MLNKFEFSDDVLEYIVRAVKNQTFKGEAEARSMLVVLDLLKKPMKGPIPEEEPIVTYGKISKPKKND